MTTPLEDAVEGISLFADACSVGQIPWLSRANVKPFAAKLRLILETLSSSQAREEELRERMQAVIDWADFALSKPGEFDSHGVRNLDGPVFDELRAALQDGEAK